MVIDGRLAEKKNLLSHHAMIDGVGGMVGIIGIHPLSVHHVEQCLCHPPHRSAVLSLTEISLFKLLF